MISEITRLASDYPLYFDFIVLVVGTCLGSFLNVVISRTPEGLSIITPGSHCICSKPIAWHDNIPIISWVILKGRARCCGQPIGIRHPFIEILTGAIFLYVWKNMNPENAFCGWIFASALVAATCIDIEHMVIPDFLTLGLGIVGVILSALVPSLHGQHEGIFLLDSLRSVEASMKGLLVGSGLLFWIAMLASAVLNKEAMGLGDVKFIGAIGAFCGWKGALVSIFGGAFLGAIAVIILIVFRKLFSNKKSEAERVAETPLSNPIPFGPMLALAGLLYFVSFHISIDHWFASFSDLF